jgi:hypothetical protein
LFLTDVESFADDEPPVISCQTTQLFYADRGTFNTSVTWIVPTATDNVDSNVSVLQTSGPELGDILSEGFHSVKYKVTDSAGNSFAALSECTIVLDVKGKCMTFTHCNYIVENMVCLVYHHLFTCKQLPLN